MEEGTLAKKYEFLSPEWFSNLRAILEKAVEANASQLQGVTYGMCERFTNCPGKGEVAHWFRVSDGVVKYGDGVLGDADVTLVIDYATCLPLSRAKSGPANDEAIAEAVRDGRFERIGDPTAIPPQLAEALSSVHDEVASATA
jgi:hypothetical protein